MLVRIPHFREIVISAFECPHCGWKNNEVQSASSICDKGKRITLKVEKEEDMNRHIVLSEYAAVRIPELDFEIPPKTAKGQLTTTEGLVGQIITNLGSFLEVEGLVDEQKKAIIEFISKARSLFDSHSFSLVLDDITGNSYIEKYKFLHVYLLALPFTKTVAKSKLRSITKSMGYWLSMGLLQNQKPIQMKLPRI